ncbi:unnamed protein product [Paramecium primaurelia]|uniref:Transmembrane protein n=1 Tax=Paramecium primaurelia TaxID=5886 RepID=A0A8S1MCI5_PARPR|nr:unnamed protein product [Paramecium primaurelia]
MSKKTKMIKQELEQCNNCLQHKNVKIDTKNVLMILMAINNLIIFLEITQSKRGSSIQESLCNNMSFIYIINTLFSCKNEMIQLRFVQLYNVILLKGNQIIFKFNLIFLNLYLMYYYILLNIVLNYIQQSEEQLNLITKLILLRIITFIK